MRDGEEASQQMIRSTCSSSKCMVDVLVLRSSSAAIQKGGSAFNNIYLQRDATTRPGLLRPVRPSRCRMRDGEDAFKQMMRSTCGNDKRYNHRLQSVNQFNKVCLQDNLHA
jgi:hypothetical protein